MFAMIIIDIGRFFDVIFDKVNTDPLFM